MTDLKTMKRWAAEFCGLRLWQASGLTTIWIMNPYQHITVDEESSDSTLCKFKERRND